MVFCSVVSGGAGIFRGALMLWLLGLVSSFTLGGLIHVLLVIAVIVIVLRLMSGRRV